MRDCYQKKMGVFGLCLALLLPLYANWRALKHNCFNITDFGILQEAIVKMPFELNAMLVVRGLRAWADHFDPITWAASPGLFLAHFNPQFLIVWEWSFWALGALFIALSSGRSLALFLWIFSRPLLEALLYPIHPNTWAMFPLLLLVFALIRQRSGLLILLAIILPLYREIYPLCFLALSIGMLMIDRKKWARPALLVGTISGLWIFLIFVVRPLVVGPVQNYAGAIIAMLEQNPLQGLNYILHLQKPGALLKLFGPLLFLFYLRRAFNSRPLSVQNGATLRLVLFFLAPYFAAHFFFGQFMHHYGIPFAVMAIGLIAFLPGEALPKRASSVVAMIFVLSSISQWNKFFQHTFFTQTKRCELTDEHALATDQALAAIADYRRPKKILASGGLIPQLIRPDRDVYHLYSWIAHQDNYDLMVYERHATGAHHPLDAGEIEKLIQQCRPMATKILVDNFYYIAMEGAFTKACTALEGKTNGGP